MNGHCGDPRSAATAASAARSPPWPRPLPSRSLHSKVQAWLLPAARPRMSCLCLAFALPRPPLPPRPVTRARDQSKVRREASTSASASGTSASGTSAGKAAAPDAGGSARGTPTGALPRMRRVAAQGPPSALSQQPFAASELQKNASCHHTFHRARGFAKLATCGERSVPWPMRVACGGYSSSGTFARAVAGRQPWPRRAPRQSTPKKRSKCRAACCAMYLAARNAGQMQKRHTGHLWAACCCQQGFMLA